VMAVVNRALSAPINIHCDHSDSMVERDAGWIQIYVENSQEAYDTIIQAFRIAEHSEVLLPTMVMLDGFFLSHTLGNIDVLPDDAVRKFVRTRQIPLVTNQEGKAVPFKLDPDNPITIGPFDLYDYYFEHKRQQEDAIQKASKIIEEVHNEYGKLSGRRYGNGLLESYYMDDAEIATVCLGSTSGTIKTVVDQLRAKGTKAGLLRLRTFRPFPTRDIEAALENVKAIAVMDRSHSYGAYGGPVFHEIRHVLYDNPARQKIVNYIYGLGGRDMPQNLINEIYKALENLKSGHLENPVRFIGVRE